MSRRTVFPRRGLPTCRREDRFQRFAHTRRRLSNSSSKLPTATDIIDALNVQKIIINVSKRVYYEKRNKR